MKVLKKDFNKMVILFLFTHLIIWTVIPSVSNNNLPLDTIEALAWGSNLDWGSSKHPPLSGFFVEIFYIIFGSQDWAYYFLSQIFVITTFFIIYIFSRDFFKDQKYSLISILLLEGIYFYNFTTPEFNVNVVQLPFWSLTVLYSWRAFKNNKNIDWILVGIFAALGMLSKYLFIYLLIAVDIFFLYMIFLKKINYRGFISLIPFFLILSPHLVWLVDNNYSPISYAFQRTGTGDQNIMDHLVYPLIFLGKQIVIFVPFFLMFLFLTPKFKNKFNIKDKKLIFLLAINIIPLILMFLTSMIMGVKIRTMWMTPFYLFFGVLVIYIYQIKINFNKLNKFIITFFILFLFSPAIYLYVSVSKKDKRTDYPGKEISKKVQENWNKKFNTKIAYVVGDEWVAGNLSYHLESRPKWIGIKKKMESKDQLSIVDIYENNLSEALSKIGYFKVYGE